MARDAPLIDAYGEGGFRLDGERREGSLLIVGDEAQSWPVRSLAELSVEALKPVLDAGRAEVESALPDPDFTPVAVGALLLWGRERFGDEWLSARRDPFRP